MNIIEHFERRKQWCEEELCIAETTPSFRLFRRTHGGGEIDLTEKHKKDLREARDMYQHAIDLLQNKPAIAERRKAVLPAPVLQVVRNSS
jgi:hypothetical protein